MRGEGQSADPPRKSVARDEDLQWEPEDMKGNARCASTCARMKQSNVNKRCGAATPPGAHTGRRGAGAAGFLIRRERGSPPRRQAGYKDAKRTAAQKAGEVRSTWGQPPRVPSCGAAAGAAARAIATTAGPAAGCAAPAGGGKRRRKGVAARARARGASAASGPACAGAAHGGRRRGARKLRAGTGGGPVVRQVCGVPDKRLAVDEVGSGTGCGGVCTA